MRPTGYSPRRWAYSVSTCSTAPFIIPQRPEWIIDSLLDNLEQDRLEVDMINFSSYNFV